MSKKEFIANYYYILIVELSEPIYTIELNRVLNNRMSLDEFDYWLDHARESIGQVSQRELFQKWLKENRLDEIWSSEIEKKEKPELISITEYASIKKISPDTVRQKILRGNLAAIKIGRNWLIDKNTPYIDGRISRKKE